MIVLEEKGPGTIQIDLSEDEPSRMDRAYDAIIKSDTLASISTAWKSNNLKQRAQVSLSKFVDRKIPKYSHLLKRELISDPYLLWERTLREEPYPFNHNYTMQEIEEMLERIHETLKKPHPDHLRIKKKREEERMKHTAIVLVETKVEKTFTPDFLFSDDPKTVEEIIEPHKVWALKDGQVVIQDMSNLLYRKNAKGDTRQKNIPSRLKAIQETISELDKIKYKPSQSDLEQLIGIATDLTKKIYTKSWQNAMDKVIEKETVSELTADRTSASLESYILDNASNANFTYNAFTRTLRKGDRFEVLANQIIMRGSLQIAVRSLIDKRTLEYKQIPLAVKEYLIAKDKSDENLAKNKLDAIYFAQSDLELSDAVKTNPDLKIESKSDIKTGEKTKIINSYAKKLGIQKNGISYYKLKELVNEEFAESKKYGEDVKILLIKHFQKNDRNYSNFWLPKSLQRIKNSYKKGLMRHREELTSALEKYAA